MSLHDNLQAPRDFGQPTAIENSDNEPEDDSEAVTLFGLTVGSCLLSILIMRYEVTCFQCTLYLV